MHLCDLVNAIKELVEEPGYSPLDWRLGMEHGGLVDAHEGIKLLLAFGFAYFRYGHRRFRDTQYADQKLLP